jgi:predicted ATP-dependent serine protease
MLSDREPAKVGRINANILVEDGVSTADLLPEYVASQILRPGGAFHGVRIVFIDSLMGAAMSSLPGRRWERTISALKICQQAGITTFSSAHINKTGTMVGPMSLRHAADCYMFMRQRGNHRILTVTKNRNGIADQRQPARLVIDPATLMLKPAPHTEPVAVSARSYVSGMGEVEIQSTIGLTFGNRRRIVSGSIPHGEIQQLLDMISDIRGIDINDTDFFVSTRMPGARIYDLTMALALCITLIGSALQQPVDESLLFLGEIDLKRRIRDVPDLLATEIANAGIAGAIQRPVRIVCSAATAAVIGTTTRVSCAPCNSIDDAVFVVWPQMR